MEYCGARSRADYSSILCPIFIQVPIMALTATAVPRVRDDIVTSLELASPFISCRLPHAHDIRGITNLTPLHVSSYCAARQTGRIYASRLRAKKLCLQTSNRSSIDLSRETKAQPLCTCQQSRIAFQSRISWRSSSKSTALSAAIIMEVFQLKVCIYHLTTDSPNNSVKFL
jgi:superfamily II DNA helicase RecQ